MKLKKLVALFASACLLSVSLSVFADDDDDDDDGGSAMQVMIDKKSGRIVSQEDDVNRELPAASKSVVTDTGLNPNISVMMGAKTEPVQYRADGSATMKLGLDSLDYLIVTIDEEGNANYSHTSTDSEEVEAAINADASSRKGEK